MTVLCLPVKQHCTITMKQQMNHKPLITSLQIVKHAQKLKMAGSQIILGWSMMDEMCVAESKDNECTHLIACQTKPCLSVQANNCYF